MAFGAGRGGVSWWLRMRLDEASLRQVQGEVKQGLNNATERGVNAAGTTAQKRLPTFFGAAFKKIGLMAAGLGATIGGGALLKSIVSVNREYERFLVQLETFEGSAQAARAAFSRMERLAATTPFAIEQLVQSLITLRAAGLQPTDEMMMSFADTAAAMGGGIDEVAMAVRQAAVGETERLKAFGITARQQGNLITLAYDDISMTVQRNAEDIANAVQKIGEMKFAGGAAREMETLNGAISNLKDNLGTLARAIGDAGLTEWITDMAAGVRDFTGAVAENKEGTQQWAGSIIWGIRAVLRTLLLVPRLFIGGVRQIATSLGIELARAWGEILAFANDAMALSNRLFKTEFEMFDLTMTERRIAKGKRMMLDYAERSKRAIEGVGEAWANVSLAAEGALPGRGATGPKKPKPDELPEVPDIEAAILDQSDVVKVRGNKLTIPLQLEPVPVPPEEARHAWGSTSLIMADFFQFASSGADEAGRAMTRAFTDSFDLIMEEGATLGDVMGSIMSGIGAAMLGGLSQFAAGKASQNFAMAAEMLAYGLAGTAVPGISNPAGAFAAAAKFAAVGAAWSAFAGLAGAAGSAVGGGGGGGGRIAGGGGVWDPGGGVADRARPDPMTLNVYIDPLDPYNPVMQDVIYIGGQRANERHGQGARVRVKPRSRS